MDFSFNEDQQMIAETAATFLASVSNSAEIRKAMATESGFDPALWQKVTQELGWQLTHIPEEFDGLGLGYVELCILFEQMGTHLACLPLFSTVALGVNALRVAGSEDQKAHWLPLVALGKKRLTLAYAGGGRRWGVEAVSASYQKSTEGYTLDGDLHYVIDGHTSDAIIVAASGTDGLKLFLVTPDIVGVRRRWTPSMDQTRKLASVSLDSANIAESAVLAGGQTELENILALASIALAAEQMGVAEAALNQTVDYIKERKQFGRAVGGFQAVKHKAADMLNRVEAARSAVYYAACIADEFFAGNELGTELLEAASIAKAYCSDAAYFNTGTAIQLHGGVGFTWEYDVHMYFKRAKAGQVSFGDSAWHKERIAKILLGDAA